MAIDKLDSLVRPNPVRSHAERKRKRRREDRKAGPPDSAPEPKRKGKIDELA